MTLATFIRKFPGAKRSGDQYIVRCPAHEDRSPSLSIGEGDHGQVLIHCHAGCAPSDVLAKVGLSLIDLFPRDFISRAQKAGARPVPNLSWKPAPLTISDTPPATYDYCDETGKLLFQVMRLAPKGFRQRVPRRDGGWEYALGDVRRVVYRLPELVGNDTIFIAEGERTPTSSRRFASQRRLTAVVRRSGPTTTPRSSWPLARRRS
jgi:putative DNA primase/helicase